MAKLARLPANDRESTGSATGAVRKAPRRPRYFAFLSYSHKDAELADWLHQQLEEFQVPGVLAGRLTENGVIPKRLAPIFRDEQELPAADDLTEEIEHALATSQYLIVLCSPNAAASRWTNAEIEAFKRSRPEGCILAAIASGEPFASEFPGREAEECFPPALRQKYDRRGRPTGKRAEPLAADLRAEGAGRRTGFLKLVAGMLGVGLDELVQRDATRRQRRLAWLTAASLAATAVASGLAITAIQARDAARDERRQAEGLVAFMLGDLKEKLEPIGRLDALDGVGSRVLAYYSKQDASQLTDAALLQRSRALSLSAEVSHLRGDRATAERLYRQAYEGTAEAVRRDPSDPQRLFDHAQNVFWLGALAREAGAAKDAESSLREYKRLATQMVALAPDNMKWRVENQNSDANLGTLLLEQRHFPEALRRLAAALQGMEALTAADPANRDYQSSLVEALAWSADANLAVGRIDPAIALRERQVTMIKRLLGREAQDVKYREKLVPAEQALGRLYGMKGDRPAALTHLRASVAAAEQLSPVDPTNNYWREQGFRSRFALAEYALRAGLTDEAATQTEIGCDAVRRLLATGAAVVSRRAGLADCEALRVELALAKAAAGDGVADGRHAVNAASALDSNDPVADRFRAARAYRLLGDAELAAGDRTAARTAWAKALAALPAGAAERPVEMDERATILRRNAREDEAQRVIVALAAMGYKRSDAFRGNRRGT